jgi:hypothetical protein
MPRKAIGRPFTPGDPRAGRPKGVPNKATADVRAAIAAFAETNAPKLQKWLDRIAKKDPARAADLFVRVLEYHVPKLSRSTIDGELAVRGTLVIQE